MASLSTSELKKSIAAILKGADLTTLSSKKVRKKLEEQYDAVFLDRKEEIDEIVMAMVTAEENDKGNDSEEAAVSEEEIFGQGNSPQNSESEEEKVTSPKKSKSAAKRKHEEEKNDVKSENNSESEPEIEEKRPPPKKSKPAAKSKPKKEAKNEEVKSGSDLDQSDDGVDDEALARKLQEEERNSRSRAVKKNFNKKDSGKKSNKSKNNEGKPRKESVYSRKCALSADLANVVGASEMARHDIVKKMWSVVRERNLFDPKNKRFALCDEQLQKVFGAKRILMFGMMKYLKNHIKDQH